MNPYDTLNIEPDADDATIKKAYRKAAHQAHPDRKGGTKEAFHQIQLAYEVLSDPERRARYDETGDTTEQTKGAMSEAEQNIIQIFAGIIDSDFHGDVIEKARKDVRNAKQQGEAERAGTNKKIAKLEKWRDRIEAKGDNLFQMVLESKLGNEQHRLENIEHSLKLADEIEDILAEYKDRKPDEQEPQGTVSIADMMRAMHAQRPPFFNSGF